MDLFLFIASIIALIGFGILAIQSIRGKYRPSQLMVTTMLVVLVLHSINDIIEYFPA